MEKSKHGHTHTIITNCDSSKRSKILSPGSVVKQTILCSDAQNTLSIGLNNSYNSSNVVKCTVDVNYNYEPGLEVTLNITNQSKNVIRTPLLESKEQHWISNFALLVFDEYSRDHIATIDNVQTSKRSGKQIILKPGASMTTTFGDVFQHINPKKYKDVIFVARSIPCEKIKKHFKTEFLNTETDPFKLRFWTHSLFRMSERVWRGDRFTSNALRTSQIFCT
ncbi:hypothetical protein AKO1_006000 [Acrasis kona]|uniref:Uncharacterized protein n=1 Tax=Acrasis kona TaxID=1008807 RepID=A0AAW2YJM6_9EUKA